MITRKTIIENVTVLLRTKNTSYSESGKKLEIEKLHHLMKTAYYEGSFRRLLSILNIHTSIYIQNFNI